MQVDFGHDIGRWVATEIDLFPVPDRIGALNVEAGVCLCSFALALLPHGRRTEVQDFDAKAKAQRTDELLDQLGVALVLGRKDHDLESPLVVAQAQTLGLHERLEQSFVLLPTHTAQHEMAVGGN